MMPTTPNGTRIWRSSRPFGRVEPRTTSPTGSGRKDSCHRPSAISTTRALVSVSLSIIASGEPAARAFSTSTAFAAMMSSDRSFRR
jgi:hypothetical protein